MSAAAAGRHSPAAERNRAAILAELQRLLPPHGVALEIASGTGQHVACFAAGLPGWTWQPSDADPDALASVAAWCDGLVNVRPALRLDVRPAADGAGWTDLPTPVDAVFCANLLHIAPWDVCAALMQAAARLLAPDGRLLVYGPFLVDGEATAASNLAFDTDLRRRDPAWGLRRLADVRQQAETAGLRWRECRSMPANNLLLVFEVAAPRVGDAA